MSNTARSILVFGIYIVVTGFTLLFAPNVLLGLFGLPPANEVWIRALGVLAIALSLYYIQAYRENNTSFFAMTVWGRLIFALGIIGLAVTTPHHLPMALFALVDLLGAAWTWFSIGQDAKLAPAS